jgi:hypothetical protein
MHNITQRAVVTPKGTIEARPMMYIALTYDHRLIDGREVRGVGCCVAKGGRWSSGIVVWPEGREGGGWSEEGGGGEVVEPNR